jgi:hypothetical protein
MIRYGPAPGSTQPSPSCSPPVSQIRLPVPSVIQPPERRAIRSPGRASSGWQSTCSGAVTGTRSAGVSHAVPTAGPQPVVVVSGTIASVKVCGPTQASWCAPNSV